MTEKEKMLNGLIYDTEDSELVNDRMKCKDLCYEYNNTRPSDIKKRDEIIKKIIGKTGEKIWIEPNIGTYIC
jgi:hypothetical protein